MPDIAIRVSDGAQYRVITDHLGSPRVIVNAATPTDVLYEAEYTTFGERTILTGDGDTLPFGFAGGLHDPDTGLVHFGARDYDPETGRWLQKEPLGFAGGMNFYVYANGDPVNIVDPTGNYAESALDVAFVAYDIYSIATAETWSDVGWASAALAGDLVGLALPFVTGVGQGIHGAGLLVRNGVGSRTSFATRAGRLAWDTRKFETIRRSYSKMCGGLGRCGGSLHHWLIPQRAARYGVPGGLINGGFNHLLVAGRVNSLMSPAIKMRGLRGAYYRGLEYGIPAAIFWKTGRSAYLGGSLGSYLAEEGW